MLYTKEHHNDYHQFDDITRYITFKKSKNHEVDFMFKSNDGNELYVEIKGLMTYLEVNKLKYLLEESKHDFYILQLTEIDWIKPYDTNEYKREFLKSKEDFETQINEIVSFVNCEITGKEMAAKSKQRLTDFIEYRAKDLERWKKLIDAESANR